MSRTTFPSIPLPVCPSHTRRTLPSLTSSTSNVKDTRIIEPRVHSTSRRIILCNLPHTPRSRTSVRQAKPLPALHHLHRVVVVQAPPVPRLAGVSFAEIPLATAPIGRDKFLAGVHGADVSVGWGRGARALVDVEGDVEEFFQGCLLFSVGVGLAEVC